MTLTFFKNFLAVSSYRYKISYMFSASQFYRIEKRHACHRRSITYRYNHKITNRRDKNFHYRPINQTTGHDQSRPVMTSYDCHIYKILEMVVIACTSRYIFHQYHPFTSLWLYDHRPFIWCFWRRLLWPFLAFIFIVAWNSSLCYVYTMLHEDFTRIILVLSRVRLACVIFRFMFTWMHKNMPGFQTTTSPLKKYWILPRFHNNKNLKKIQ